MPQGFSSLFDDCSVDFFGSQPRKTQLNHVSTGFFSYIRLRRVLLLRSDIRLTPSDIRFASFGGEYNITAERSGAISLLQSKNITLTKSAYH